MRSKEFITEQARAPLYHGTSSKTAEEILQTNTLLGRQEAGSWEKGSTPNKELGLAPRKGNDKFAFSKHPVLNPEDQEFVDWMRRLMGDDTTELDALPMDQWDAALKKYKGLTAPIPGKEAKGVSSLSRNIRISREFGPVIFVLDQDLLRRDIGKRIHPYSYDTTHRGPGGRDESEESVWGDITNFKKYILKVISNEPIDPNKFPLVAHAIKNTESVRVPGMPDDPRPYSDYYRPATPQRPLTYNESLEAKLASEMAIKPAPKFTALEWAIMEGGGSLEEAEASDDELRQRYGDFDPEDKPMLPTTQLNRVPAPTLWTCYDAIENILGRGRVTDDEDEIEPGMYYVYQSSGPAMFRDTEDSGPGGSINVPDLDSKAAKDVAVAVHEAYHAYVHDRTKGQGAVHSNEKIINNLAEKWLRAHLSGPALHVALETIVGSRISYGKDHIPKSRVTDMRENFADGKNPQDKGDSKRHGVPTKAGVSTLRKVAKQGGRKGQLAHWMANMKAGKAKKQ